MPPLGLVGAQAVSSEGAALKAKTVEVDATPHRKSGSAQDIVRDDAEGFL